MSSSCDSSEKEFDIEEEDLAMILAMHINKNRSTVVQLWVDRKFGGIGSMPTID